MGITREEVFRVARLAHIDLNDAEAAALPEQLDRIIEYVRSLDAVAAAGVESEAKAPATPLREDEPAGSLPVDEVLRGAPARRGDFFGVPRVIGGEEEA